MSVQRLGDDAHRWELYGGAGHVDVEWYFRGTTQLGANVLRYRLAPGAEEGVHHHADDEDACSPTSDELYVVTRGEIVLVVDDERTLLRAGDAAYAPNGQHHGVRNESDDDAELVLVFGVPMPDLPRPGP